MAIKSDPLGLETSPGNFPIQGIEYPTRHGEGGIFRYHVGASTSTKYFIVLKLNDFFPESYKKEETVLVLIYRNIVIECLILFCAFF